MTEENTFNRLRRRDIDLVYEDIGILMRQILRRDNLKEIDTKHPEVKNWLDNEGYTSLELQSYLRQSHEARRKRMLEMEQAGDFG